MRSYVRFIYILLLCSGLAGCSSHSPYPDQWPKIVDSPHNGCNNISGDYVDKIYEADKETVSLTHYIAYGDYNLRTKPDAQRIVDAATHVIIVQSDKIIELTIMKEQETLLKTNLIIGKDIFCKEGLHIPTHGTFCTGSGIGYEKDDYILLPAADGSLIIHHTAYGAGCLCCLIPVPGSSSHYHRFEKYITQPL